MTKKFQDARDWFFEARFGLFIHWGIYAIPGWQEQHMFRRRLARKDYVPLADQFNPVEFDPDNWLDLAESIGMKYLCFTAKHIDGFCMWASRQTAFNVMHTPYHRDVLRMLAEACHRRRFPLCLYYSICDMNHPNYPNAGRSYELPAPEPGDEPNLEKYLAFLKAQVHELCTQYGEIHGFWWDAHVFGHKDPDINTMIRRLQPQAVINGRGFDDGDFSTPERDWDDSVNTLSGFTRPTEACQSIGAQSWGYRENEDFYADRHLIASLDKVLVKGGNYLLNVGPDSRGRISPESRRILTMLGLWYNRVRESFQNVMPCPDLFDNREILVTRRGITVYIHLNKPPVTDSVLLRPLNILPVRAVLLNTNSPVDARVELLPSCWQDGKPWLRLARLPVNSLAGSVPVVKLEFDRL